jgi:cell division protein FtsZ
MIPYSRDPKKTTPASAVKIIGLGGAGTNMLERIALDGIEGAELLALNTDIRTLGSCMAPGKIQLGANLTKGLGSGGDPDIGHQAVLEAEQALRAALKDRRIVFLCVGLGGGTGSGAAPIVTRIAREEGAFVVVFATMPFAFEGRRRREQAESALNELAVLSNALVTFDNNRMGELVLAKQGIHEAFAAADHMIREAIMAVLRLVIRPGLIHVGLDDLMSALRTTRSRCLFGSGIATGRDRAAKALRIALASPLLDQGSLLNEAQTVVVHLSGGESLTLFEVELLMQNLGKHIPEKAHVLFGAAVDPAMGDSLSVTLISALPEDTLAMTPRDSLSRGADQDSPLLNPSQGFTPADEPEPVIEAPPPTEPLATSPPPSDPAVAAFSPAGLFDDAPFAGTAAPAKVQQGGDGDDFALFDSIPAGPVEKPSVMVAEFVAVSDDDGPALENLPDAMPVELAGDDIKTAGIPGQDHDALSSTLPPKRTPGTAPWTIAQGPREQGPREEQPGPAATPDPDTPELPLIEAPKLKLGVKSAGTQSELSLDSAPRGRFEGESPNVYGGEDLDLPPFLRKKK